MSSPVRPQMRTTDLYRGLQTSEFCMHYLNRDGRTALDLKGGCNQRRRYR